jgi:glyceraldehyde-3-phosphate dehydrogenase/erythrose-4-phosphate dehydrogenase
MINIGINGFGRIGKCVFLQLLNNVNFSIKCLNATEIETKEGVTILLFAKRKYQIYNNLICKKGLNI